MKTISIITSVLIIVLLISIYVFIPAELTVTKVAVVNCSPEAAYRTLSSINDGKKWWSDSSNNGTFTANGSKSYFTLNKDTFQITSKLHSTFEIVIKSDAEVRKTVLHILPISFDTVALQWKTSFFAGINPLTRIRHYQQAVALKNKMTRIINNMVSFLQNKDKVYGVSIQKVSTKDTFLVATKTTLTTYPTTDQIYTLIEKLQTYLYRMEAQQTGSPMVNVTPEGPNQFTLMVAIPTDRAISGNNEIFYRRMVPGFFLTAEVTGGVKRIEEAVADIKLYMNDYKKTAMAIPFQSITTDRKREPDSTKWKTKLYFPIAY